MRKTILALAVSTLGCLAHAAPPRWDDAPFSYYANGASVERVLRDFARDFSLRLEWAAPASTLAGAADASPDVRASGRANGPSAGRANGRLQGRVNGRFNSANPTAFLDQMGGVYGFSWFTYAGVLYVSDASDVVTRVVDARGGSIGRLRQALDGLGVLDPRFGWGEMPERGIALVSGPARYVALIQQIVAQLPSSAGAQEVRVFRLKHASVLDRTIRYRDREIVTPGMATMLRQLIAGDGRNGAANNDSLALISAPLRTGPAPVFGTAGAGGASGLPGLPPLPALGMPVDGVTPRATAATVVAPATVGSPGGMSPAGPGGAPSGVGGAVDGPGAAGAAVRTVAPSIQADPRLNAIVVEDVPERMPIYQKLIDELDVPTALIQIEAAIIDVSRNHIKELGINWGARLGRVGVGFGNTSSVNGGGARSGVLDAVGASAPGTTNLVASAGNSFAAKISLLEQAGDARVLASPSVLTADNQGAVLDLSDTFYVQTRGQQVATVTPVSVGTTLNVTPRYVSPRIAGPYGEIELTVDIEDGKILPTQYNGLPVVRKSTIGTQARIAENEALVIAGYNSADDQITITRTPWLGELPLIGALFRNRETRERNTERLFVIRPTIVGLPEARAAASDPAPPARE